MTFSDHSPISLIFKRIYTTFRWRLNEGLLQKDKTKHLQSKKQTMFSLTSIMEISEALKKIGKATGLDGLSGSYYRCFEGHFFQSVHEFYFTRYNTRILERG